MKISKLAAILTLLTIVMPAVSSAKGRYIDSFSRSKVGNFPKGWRTRIGQRDKARKVYRVQEEGGNKYLAADDETGISVQIFKLAHWDIDKYPILTWRWRARKLPKGANETNPARNDSACGIYVSFGLLRGRALKYVWSTTAPTGTYYKKNDKMHIIVKRTGSPGGWVTERANIIEDSKKTFGKVPDRMLTGIAILTDSNATHSPAACDYDNIGYANE